MGSGKWIGLLAGCAILGACGGGGVSSIPAPSPAPTPAPSSTPTPTPSQITSLIVNLTVDKTFTEKAVNTDVTLAVADGVVSKTTDKRAPMSVVFDAAAGSYKVTFDGRTKTFTPADRLLDRVIGEAHYATTDDQHLTLSATPFSSAFYFPDIGVNQYVGLGYWQANKGGGGNQQTDFTSFVYGFNTPGSSVPKTGTGHYFIDIFGLLTIPDKELRTIQGGGDFDIDFAAGSYLTRAFVDEYDLVTRGGRSGALTFQSGGHLTSGSSFSGPFTFQSDLSLFGTLEGGFYGPHAEELGATFNAENSEGAVLTGSLTGQDSAYSSTTDGSFNVTLTHPGRPQQLFGDSVTFRSQVNEFTPDFASMSSVFRSGSVDFGANGRPQLFNFTYAYVPSESDRVAGPANFDTYSIVAGSSPPARISFYKIGSANSEIALTYTSFATYSTVGTSPGPGGDDATVRNDVFGLYGIHTPENLMAAMTGTATYNGVVYGRGGRLDGEIYDVGGSSLFNLNFDTQSFSGNLTLNGKARSDSSAIDFGKWNFAGNLNVGMFVEAPLTASGPFRGASTIRPFFFGPTGEEIGATFTAAFPNAEDDPNFTLLTGVTVAKRP